MRFGFALTPMVALVIPQVLGCHLADPPDVQELRWLEKADPIADARAALAKGDHRLRAVRGLVVSIPGTDGKDFDALKQGYGINEIAGTTDAFRNEEHHRLVGLAYAYAEAYNRQVISGFKPAARP